MAILVADIQAFAIRRIARRKNLPLLRAAEDTKGVKLQVVSKKSERTFIVQESESARSHWAASSSAITRSPFSCVWSLPLGFAHANLSTRC